MMPMSGRRFLLVVFVVFLSTFLDYLTTYVCLGFGLAEANPFANSLMRSGLYLPAKFGGAGLLCFIYYLFIRRGYFLPVYLSASVYSFLHFTAVVNNVFQLLALLQFLSL